MEMDPQGTGNCCRLCASISVDVVSIYNDNKTGNELADRINMHLPVTVAITDTLTLLCCTRCANTVTNFHELVLTCLETDNQLKKDLRLGKDFLDDHTYVDLDIQGPNDVKVDDSLLNGEDTFNSLTILKAHLSNNIPSVRRKQSISEKPDESILKLKSLPVGEEVELAKYEDAMEDNSALMTYPCELCNVMCHSEMEFEDHVQKVHKEQYEVLEIWPERDKAPKKRGTRTPARTKLDKAVLAAAKIMVNGKVYYQCQECAKILCSSYTFLWHMRIHTGERPHVCDLCGKQFRVAQGLIRHLRETHEGIKNFPCDICSRMFSSKRNVEEHRNIHTNDRPYVCDMCGKRFKQKASLFVHNRSHTDIFPFPCTYCAQTFRTSAALLMHVRRHTGEKPFTCDACGRAFRVKYELKRHKLIHSDEKPFECALCHLTFRQKRYLRNHNRVTHGIVSAKNPE